MNTCERCCVADDEAALREQLHQAEAENTRIRVMFHNSERRMEQAESRLAAAEARWERLKAAIYDDVFKGYVATDFTRLQQLMSALEAPDTQPDAQKETP